MTHLALLVASVMLDIKYEMYPDLLVSLRGWILPIDSMVLEAFVVLKLFHLQLGSISISEVKLEALIVGMWQRVSKLVAECSLGGVIAS